MTVLATWAYDVQQLEFSYSVLCAEMSVINTLSAAPPDGMLGLAACCHCLKFSVNADLPPV